MTLYEWLKFEDIFSELFLVKCRIVVEERTARKIGEAHQLWYRIYAGGGIVLLIVILLWGTLLPFMSGTTFGKPNQVDAVNLIISIDGYATLYSGYSPKKTSDISGIDILNWQLMLSYLTELSSSRFKLFNSEDQPSANLVSFSSWSQTPFYTTPLARDNLVQALEDRDEFVTASVELQFTRPKPDTVHNQALEQS